MTELNEKAWPKKSVVENARRLMATGVDARSAAIEAVDGYHGYSFEFAASPTWHRDLYDCVEEELNEQR